MGEIILVFLKGRRTMGHFGLHRRQVHLVTDTGSRSTTWYLYSLDFIPTSRFFSSSFPARKFTGTCRDV